jgi:hypothetical protein
MDRVLHFLFKAFRSTPERKRPCRRLILKLGFHAYPIISDCPDILRQSVSFLDINQIATYTFKQKLSSFAPRENAGPIAWRLIRSQRRRGFQPKVA